MAELVTWVRPRHLPTLQVSPHLWNNLFMLIMHETNRFVPLFNPVVLKGGGRWLVPSRDMRQCLKTFWLSHWEEVLLASSGRAHFYPTNILQCPGQTPHNKETNQRTKASRAEIEKPWLTSWRKRFLRIPVTSGVGVGVGKEKQSGKSVSNLVSSNTNPHLPVRNVYWLMTDSVYCWSVKEVGALWPWPGTAGSVCSPLWACPSVYCFYPNFILWFESSQASPGSGSQYTLCPDCLDMAFKKRGGLLVTASFGWWALQGQPPELLMPRSPPFLIWEKSVKKGATSTTMERYETDESCARHRRWSIWESSPGIPTSWHTVTQQRRAHKPLIEWIWLEFEWGRNGA